MLTLLNNQGMNFFKMDPNNGANGGGGGGGQGSGNSGASGGGAGGILDPDNGSGGGNSGGSGNGNPPGGDKGNGGGSGTTPPSIPQNWKDILPDDVKNDPSLAKIIDLPNLAKSYINAQKMVGADKIALPQKGNKDEYRAVFQKLGLPEKVEEYKLELDPKTPAVDKEFTEAFRKSAHELGILPEQAKGLAEWFAKFNDEAYQAQTRAAQQAAGEGIAKLKQEWGETWNENVAKGKAALREFATEDEYKELSKMGLTNNPVFIKFAAKVGATLAEGKIRGEGGSGGTGGYTPDSAKARIGELKAGQAYWDPNHAEHAAVKKEVSALYKITNPGVRAEIG